MHILRTLGRQLASNLLRLLILSIAIVGTLWLVFGSAGSVKHLLDKSGIYERLPGIITDQFKQQQPPAADSANVLDQPQVSSAVKATFTADFLRSTANQVIDGTYHWLDGKVEQPDFRINLRPAITTFKEQLTTAAVARYNGLPECTPQQLAQIQADHSKSDLLSLACRPAGVPVDTLRQQFTDSLDKQLSGPQPQQGSSGKDSTGSTILQTQQLTASELPKDNQGRSVFDNLSAAPTAYQWLYRGLLLAIVAAILLALAVVYLFPSRRRGARSLGITFVGIGLLILIVGVAGDILFSRAVNTQSLHLTDSSPQQAAVTVARTVSQAIDQDLRWFGIGYLLAGVAVLVVLRLTRPRETDAGTAATEAKPMADSPKDVEKNEA